MAGRCRSCCRRSSPLTTGSGCPRRVVSQVRHLAGRSGPRRRPRRLARACSPGLTPPPWSAHRTGLRWAARRCLVSDLRRDHSGPQRPGPLAPHHRQHRAAGRLGAAADVADRPARRRLRHRGLRAPTELPGAESMVGLLINTVPVRAQHHRGNHHQGAARPTATRPQPHPGSPTPGT